MCQAECLSAVEYVMCRSEPELPVWSRTTMNTVPWGDWIPPICCTAHPIAGRVWDRLWDKPGNLAIYLVKYAYS